MIAHNNWTHLGMGWESYPQDITVLQPELITIFIMTILSNWKVFHLKCNTYFKEGKEFRLNFFFYKI